VNMAVFALIYPFVRGFTWRSKAHSYLRQISASSAFYGRSAYDSLSYKHWWLGHRLSEGPCSRRRRHRRPASLLRPTVQVASTRQPIRFSRARHLPR
jgi:hypothetical protein